MAAGSVAGGNLLVGRAQLAASIVLVDQMSGGLKSAGRNISRFEGRLLKLTGGAKNFSATVAGMSQGIVNSARTFALMGGAIAVAGRAVGDFEKQIAGVQAIANISDREIAKVRKQAIDLSRDYAFSAKEIAEGQRFIAQTGAKANEILAATPAILNLATSTMEEFDLAAKLTIKTLNAFRLSVSNVSEVTRVVNDLQFAVNNSVNTLTSLNDALKFSAPFAQTLGISLEDLITALQLTANAGLEAGIAGRSLGQGLQQLIRSGMRGATDEAKAFSNSLAEIIDNGGTLADVVETTSARFGELSKNEKDALTSLNEMNDAEIDAIENGEKVFTTTERLSELIQVFGVRGARVFAVLLGQSGRMNEFRESMEQGVVTAAQQAEVALDNLADQSQIAMQRVTAGILDSGFGDVLTAEIKKLNEAGTTAELGETLGKILTELAENAVPVLIDVLELLTDTLEAVGPGLAISGEAILQVMTLIVGVLDAMPDGVANVAVAYVALNKILKLNTILNLANAKALTATISNLKLQRVNLVSVQSTQKTGIALLSAKNAAEVRASQVAIGAMVAEGKATDILIKKKLMLSRTSKALIGAGGVAALGFGLNQARQADSTSDIVGGALTSAAGGAAAGFLFGGPIGAAVGGAAAGAGALIWGGIAKGANDKKARRKAEKAWEENAEIVINRAFGEAVTANSEVLGADMAFAIQTGLEGGLDNFAETFKQTLNDSGLTEEVAEFLASLEEPAQGEGLQLDLNIVFKQGKGLFEDGDEATAAQLRAIQDINEAYAEGNIDLAERKRLVRELDDVVRRTQQSDVFGFTGKTFAEVQGTDVNPQLIAAVNEIIGPALATAQERVAINIRSDAEGSGLTEEEILAKIREEQANIDVEAIIRAATSQVGTAAGLSPEAIALLQNTVLGSGMGITSLTFNIDGTFTPVIEDLGGGVFDEMISGSKDWQAKARIGAQLLLGGSQVVNATFLEAGDAMGRVGARALDASNRISELAEEAAKGAVEVSKLRTAAEKASIAIRSSMVSAIESFADFVTNNAAALEGSGINLAEQQDKLARVRAFEAVRGVIDARTAFKLARVSQQLADLEVRIKQEDVKAIRDSIATEVKRAKANLVYAKSVLAAADNLLKFLPPELQQQLEAQIEQLNRELKAAGTPGENVKNINKFVAESEALYGEQVSALKRQQGQYDTILQVLGLTVDDLEELSPEMLKVLAEAALATQQMSAFNDAIGNMISPAESLGGALRASQASLISMGHSASAIDQALKAFQKVQFLNAQLQFLNNFKELAAATGASLNLNDVITQAQNRLLQSGGQFLEELLAVGSPEELSEIFARQNFLEQKVNNNTVINLQAELIFPEGITADQREEISRIAIEATTDAINDSPFRP